VTIDTQDCSSIDNGEACQQVLSISTEDSLLPFPDCDNDLIYDLDLTMNCIQFAESGTALDLNCDVDILGGCTFHVSTDFCPELTIEADNIGAELKSYREVTTTSVDGTMTYMTEEDKAQAAFAYLNLD